MTTSTIARSALLRGSGSILAGLVRRIAIASKIRRDVALLHTLNESQLDDIGIRRGEIEDALRRGRRL